MENHKGYILRSISIFRDDRGYLFSTRKKWLFALFLQLGIGIVLLPGNIGVEESSFFSLMQICGFFIVFRAVADYIFLQILSAPMATKEMKYKYRPLHTILLTFICAFLIFDEWSGLAQDPIWLCILDISASTFILLGLAYCFHCSWQGKEWSVSLKLKVVFVVLAIFFYLPNQWIVSVFNNVLW